MFQLDDENNLIVKNGETIYLTGIDEEAQYLKNYLKMTIGDIEDDSIVDWLGTMRSKTIGIEVKKNILINRLENCSIIQQVNKVDATEENGDLIFTINVKTNTNNNITINV